MTEEMGKVGLEKGKVGKGHPPIASRFKPGKPGGPGRPKATQTQRDMRALAREHTLSALQTIVDIQSQGESESNRLNAANILLEKGWGKDNQPFSAETPVSVEIVSPIASRLKDALSDSN